MAPTMFMCLAICATCACHLVIFSEKSLFVNAINLIIYRSAQQSKRVLSQVQAPSIEFLRRELRAAIDPFQGCDTSRRSE